MFHEEETISRVPENGSHTADTMDQDNENGEIGTSAEIVLEHSDKPQGGDVRICFLFVCLHFLLFLCISCLPCCKMWRQLFQLTNFQNVHYEQLARN